VQINVLIAIFVQHLDLIKIVDMPKIKDLKPTWLGVTVTVVGMLVAFAISSGKDSQQTSSNTKNIERIETELNDHIDMDSQRHAEVMRSLGRIEGALGTKNE
jgi:hypothetical protein